MPRIIACDERTAIGFDEFVDSLDAAPFDPRDEDSFAALAPALKRLANNPDFLADRIVAELKTRFAAQARKNGYSFQVLLLHSAPGYFIRANFWPAANDSFVRTSGTAPFFYDVPHDHNFSFLTVGYSGPGYWSDYYEYDYENVAGYPGEAVDLRFVERARLSRGKIMLYRAHRDIHRQLPADSLSVSLNIMEASERTAWLDQYRFDLEKGEVAGLLNPMPSETLLRLAAHFGAEAGRALVDEVAHRHPNDRLRFAAIDVQAAAIADPAGQVRIFERGCGDRSMLVRELSRDRLSQIEAMRIRGEQVQTGPNIR